jgi:broad specificity phosphatase PhoE
MSFFPEKSFGSSGEGRVRAHARCQSSHPTTLGKLHREKDASIKYKAVKAMIRSKRMTCSWNVLLISFSFPALLSAFTPIATAHIRLLSALFAVPEVEIVSEMPEPLPDDLKNHYYLLRHGQSTANVAGIISSARSLAYTEKHGLTELGYQQGKSAAHQLISLFQNQPRPAQKVVFVSSPFARAHQTAQACLDGLTEYKDQVQEMGLEVSHDIIMEDRLMERYFGRLDGEAIYTYAYVWPVDKYDVTHTAFDVESVAAVSTRLWRVVQDHESTFENAHIVWTSHADVLQIAQLYAADYDNVGSFSSFRFGNGEVRPMKQTKESLSEPVPLPPLDRTIKQT